MIEARYQLTALLQALALWTIESPSNLSELGARIILILDRCILQFVPAAYNVRGEVGFGKPHGGLAASSSASHVLLCNEDTCR